MKKRDLLPGLAILLALSCNHQKEGGRSAAAQKNLEAAHGISKCFETKDFSKLGDYVAADAVDHAGENGDIRGVENMKADYAKMSGTFTSLKSEVIKELADDEFVMSWMRFTGVMSGDLYGKKAGDTMVSSSIELSKCRDGKVIEHWTFMEPAEMMKMTGGSMPPPALPDSTGVKKP